VTPAGVDEVDEPSYIPLQSQFSLIAYKMLERIINSIFDRNEPFSLTIRKLDDMKK